MKKLTAKEQAFADALLQNHSQLVAYRLAGYATKNMKPNNIHVEASRVAAREHVRAYIDRMRSESAKRMDVTLDEIIAKARTNYELALAHDKIGDANKAVELLGKTIRAFTDRVEVAPQAVSIEMHLGPEQPKETDDGDQE